MNIVDNDYNGAHSLQLTAHTVKTITQTKR